MYEQADIKWVDVTGEMFAEPSTFSGRLTVLYYHKFGPVFYVVVGRNIIPMEGLKSGNYKIEVEFVSASPEVTVRTFMMEPARMYK